MKKAYGIFLLLLFFATACNSDQSPTAEEQPQSQVSIVYQDITKSFEAKKETPPTRSTKGIWDYLKKIASADAQAAAAYAAKYGMKSDWKEALIVGAAASVEAAFKNASSKINASDSKTYQTLVLADIEQIKSQSYQNNFMDDLGYMHYVLVNEVLKDSTLSQISPSNLHGAIYDKVFAQAKLLNIHASYEKAEAVDLLDKIYTATDDNSDAYFAQLFPFSNPKDKQDYKTIAQMYRHTFDKIRSYAVFTSYSQEMEAAVLQDDSLSKKVKEILLLEMATYRFGYSYYSSTL